MGTVNCADAVLEVWEIFPGSCDFSGSVTIWQCYVIL